MFNLVNAGTCALITWLLAAGKFSISAGLSIDISYASPSRHFLKA